MSIPSVVLSSGYKMPIFGLGTFLSKPNEVYTAVYEAIKDGYRLIDTAIAYMNEKEIGQAIHDAVKDGLVKREELFITTKLWVTDFEPECARKSFAQSLKNLQLDYLDLYLIHYPFEIKVAPEDEAKRDPNNYFSIPLVNPNHPELRLGWNVNRMANCWKALEELVEQGKIHSIGVCNFTVKKLKEFIPFCTIKPAINQVELHPQLQQWMLYDYCKENNIWLTAYCPLGHPNRTTDHRETKLAPMEKPLVIALGKKYNKTPAQIILRWAVQRGTIVIPKTVTSSRLLENMNIFDFELTEEEMTEIKGLDEGQRGPHGHQTAPLDSTHAERWDNEYTDKDWIN